MKRHVVPVLAAVVVGLTSLAVGFPASAADGGRPLTVEMAGAAERPGPGDPDGTGTATFRINPGQERICYSLMVAGIAPATAAHIHVAGPDAPGPVVVPLAAPTGGSSSGCASVERDLALAVLRHPEGYYVNIHNADYPAGAVRAQLG